MTTRQVYPFVRPPELGSPGPVHHPVIVVGAGPIGLTMMIELAMRGIPAVILDDDNVVSVGSRAICYAKRTLEIWDRLGVGEVMLDKGVRWNVGRVFFGDSKEPVYSFNMLDEEGYKFPGFINLQQYYCEEFLIDRLAELGIAVRWRNRVTAVEPGEDRVTVTVETPEGEYRLTCDWLIAADGSRSPIRKMLGLEFEGRIFEDHFLIADIRMKQDFPAERWFWFDPPFNRGQSALLHRQPDDVWRLDFQLGWNIDREAELKPERIAERIRAMLGDDVEFEFEWTSIYTFQCRQLDRFRHGRVIFAGDSAHLVSPFGARGANSGVQDVDNLGWKLDLVMKGLAPMALLDSYDAERVFAARENLLNSTRSTDFITPKTPASRAFRDAVLELSQTLPFARAFVNSGRLSVPATLSQSPLNTPDRDSFAGKMVPGAPAADAAVKRENGAEDWLLSVLSKDAPTGFAALVHLGDGAAPDLAALADRLGGDPVPVKIYAVSDTARAVPGNVTLLVDSRGDFRRRYDAEPGTTYLLRPDHHVTARWRECDAGLIRAARDRALAITSQKVKEEAA